MPSVTQRLLSPFFIEAGKQEDIRRHFTQPSCATVQCSQVRAAAKEHLGAIGP